MDSGVASAIMPLNFTLRRYPAKESLDDPNELAGALLALRTVAEAYGGLRAVATEAGITRESLYRALSPKGNPTLKTLLAVIRTVGLRLSVEAGGEVAA